MFKILKLKKKDNLKKLSIFLDKRRQVDSINFKLVAKIIREIKKNKKKALIKYEKIYGKNLEIIPSQRKISKSIKSLNPKVKKAIDFTYNRILKVHKLQLKNIKDINFKDSYQNIIQYKNIPIKSIAIYVPGNLPSTLLMNGIPAKLAKVKRIVLASPKINGKLNSAVLYAAKKLGIKEIYSIGGAQAIASLAYIQKVDKIIGPGNKFVAEAKRQLSGKIIGTESMFAGPSEICIIADRKTNVDQIITSLISQAEHDLDSQSILVTKDNNLIQKVKAKKFDFLKKLPRKKIAIKSLKKHSILIRANSDKQIVEVINEIAPEHLEINTKNYKKYLKGIYNVGSICNGQYTPMSLSDYSVGTNHILPTSGSAKYSSGLNLSEFIKKISIVKLSKLGVEKIANPAITLSEFEQLKGHTQSIKSRLRRK